jgi:hypothetical protein
VRWSGLGPGALAPFRTPPGRWLQCNNLNFSDSGGQSFRSRIGQSRLKPPFGHSVGSCGMLCPNLSALTDLPLTHDAADAVVAMLPSANAPLVVQTTATLLSRDSPQNTVDSVAPFWVLEVHPETAPLEAAWRSQEFGDEYVANSLGVINQACLEFSALLTTLIMQQLQLHAHTSHSDASNRTFVYPADKRDDPATHIEVVSDLLTDKTNKKEHFNEFKAIYNRKLDAFLRNQTPAQKQQAAKGGPSPQNDGWQETYFYTEGHREEFLYRVGFGFTAQLRVRNDARTLALLQHRDAGRASGGEPMPKRP